MGASEGESEKPSLWARLKPLPIWVFLGITACCLIFKENYPFTHNPMYANLPDRVRYYRVMDQDGENVPFREAFGYSLIDLMRKIKDKRKKLMGAAGIPADKEEDVLRFEKEALEPVMAWYFKNRRAKGDFVGKPLPYESVTVIKILSTREGKEETELGTVEINKEGAS